MVATGVGEVGELIRGVGVLLLKVVVTLLSEVGDKDSVVDGWGCEGWDGSVVPVGKLGSKEVVFSGLMV